MTDENNQKPRITLTDGRDVTPDHKEIKINGQQKDYIVLSEEERAKGFKRPVRDVYIHVGVGAIMNGPVLVRPGGIACGTRTIIGKGIAETYACDPKFYGGTFCVGCRQHFPLNQFVWEGTNEEVGS